MPDHTEQPQNTFVVRFWWEWPGEGAEYSLGWRGRIEHVQSDDGRSFHDVAGMISFIAQFIPLHMESARAIQDSTSKRGV